MSYRNAVSLFLLTSLTLFSSAGSDSPAPNTIPVIAMKAGQDATSTGSSQYIDADMFHNLSLAGRSSVSVDIEVHWIDNHDQHCQVDTVQNLTTAARDIGPVDLSVLGNDWTGMVKKLWLELTAGSGNLSSDVRIGWIRLTE